MEINSAFGSPELGPGKQVQAKINSSGIEAEKFVFEAKFPLFARAFFPGK